MTTKAGYAIGTTDSNGDLVTRYYTDSTMKTAVSILKCNVSFGVESGYHEFIVDFVGCSEVEDFSGSGVEAIGDVVEVVL